MSDSESDDTDVLVLIPPDLFLIDSNRGGDLIETKGNKQINKIKNTEDSQNPTYSLENFTNNCAGIVLNEEQNNCRFSCNPYSSCCDPSCSIAPMSSSYNNQNNRNNPNNYNRQEQCLENANINGDRYKFPFLQSELESINEKISQIEKNYSISSEISSISNCTARCLFQSDGLHEDDNNMWYKMSNDDELTKRPRKFHSTPKYDKIGLGNRNKNDVPMKDAFSAMIKKYSDEEEKNEVLKEINQFFQSKTNGKNEEENNIHHDNAEEEKLSTPATYRVTAGENDAVISSQELPVDNGNRLPEEYDEDEEKLISLSEIWEGDNARNHKLTLEEERLRRQHCEKTIQALQTKLLEYQQRISIAIEVDKRKDIQFNKQKQENLNFKKKLTELEDQMRDLENHKDKYITQLVKENEDIKTHRKHIEKELDNALNLVRKTEEKNEILQAKIESYSKVSSEVGTFYKQQIDDLQELVSKAKNEERLAKDEVVKMHSLLVKIEVNTDKTVEENNKFKKEVQQLQNKLKTLEQDKNNLFDKLKEEKDRIILLEKRNKDLQDSITVISKREKQILKEFEQQKSSLKTHYQEQLEAAVDQKVKEFQAQLDSAEEFLRSEGKQRERLIAERAIKQLSIIKEKTEKEFHLIHEKHNEEIKLYRIQLVNASRKINEIQDQLDLLKCGRAEIAGKLYHIMETQWKKALEILTNPNAEISDSFQIFNPSGKDQEKLDGAISRQKDSSHKPSEKEDIPSTYRINGKNEENRKETDRLQAYIEMLLNKSPRDLENLDEILLMPKKVLKESYKIEKHGETSNGNLKPPWK